MKDNTSFLSRVFMIIFLIDYDKKLKAKLIKIRFLSEAE